MPDPSDPFDVYDGDPVMRPAFVSLVLWAARQPDIITQFEDQSGEHLPPPPRTSLDAMIDAATGVHDEYVTAFVRWVHDTMWAGDDTE